MKLCKDCKWLDPAGLRTPNWWLCGNPRFLRRDTQPDYVTGEPVQPRKPFAFEARDDRNACGPDAKGWEAGGSPERGFGAP
jgi:hypothetical protein